jgi:hypothetical protein
MSELSIVGETTVPARRRRGRKVGAVRPDVRQCQLELCLVLSVLTLATILYFASDVLLGPYSVPFVGILVTLALVAAAPAIALASSLNGSRYEIGFFATAGAFVSGLVCCGLVFGLVNEVGIYTDLLRWPRSNALIDLQALWLFPNQLAAIAAAGYAGMLQVRVAKAMLLPRRLRPLAAALPDGGVRYLDGAPH